MKKLLINLIIFIAIFSCNGNVSAFEEKLIKPEDIIFPPNDGIEKVSVYVLQMGLTKREVKRYPKLIEKNVGFGVDRKIKDALNDTKRFKLISENLEIRKALRELAEEERASKAKYAITFAKQLGAKMAVYGEVEDYAEEINEETVIFKTTKQTIIHVDIQLHFIDVETLEFFPYSGTGTGKRWGTASKVAVRKAVLKYLNNSN
jgi:curli biogenesis system outer membrane secretion channel CsgG